jgi:hypothetical protein
MPRARSSDGRPSPDGAAAASPAPVPSRASRWRRRLRLALFVVPLLAVLLALGYFWLALHYAYSTGDRAGYVQKFSRKGWVCKTWEGELAMVSLPGAMPEIFRFTVRDDAVARTINQHLGERVALSYEQHEGLPRCLGETEYFITAVRRVQP